MAEIWLAIIRGPHGFEKTAVLKVIRPELSESHEFVQMFLDEARLAAHLDHNNIVRVYDFGQAEGRYYLAMEHLAGEDLASIVSTCRQRGQHIPLNLAVEIIAAAATGLHSAHELVDPQGQPLLVVHRDVSPSNLFVTYHGVVKLVDFGIARAASNITRTQAGTVKGKAAYLSPEQALGQPLDRRSDVFALGTVMYELVTLGRPFKRDTDLAMLRAVLEADVSRPSELRADVPRDLEAIIAQAMTRDREARYQTAAALSQALTQWLAERRHSRSEEHVAGFMRSLFDEERRRTKLLIARPPVAPTEHTPSPLRNLTTGLEPIRSDPMLGAALSEHSAHELDIDIEVDAGHTVSRRWLFLAVGFALAALVVVVVGCLYATEPARPTTIPEPDFATSQPVIHSRASAEAVRVAKPDAAVIPDDRAPTLASGPAPTSPVVRRGRLTLDTNPYCEVFLDGRSIGETPLVEHSLPAGIHTLTLVNPTRHLRQTIEVEIQPGRVVEKRLKL